MESASKKLRRLPAFFVPFATHNEIETFKRPLFELKTQRSICAFVKWLSSSGKSWTSYRIWNADNGYDMQRLLRPNQNISRNQLPKLFMAAEWHWKKRQITVPCRWSHSANWAKRRRCFVSLQSSATIHLSSACSFAAKIQYCQPLMMLARFVNTISRYLCRPTPQFKTKTNPWRRQTMESMVFVEISIIFVT